MNSLPNELIIVVFEFIKLITDKRQFLKTSKFHNNLTTQSMLNYEKNYNIPHFIYQLDYCVEKFTLELCHDLYFNLIPEHYITKSNKILVSCLAYYNNVSLLELANSKDCNMDDSLNFGVLGGHISVLEWCLENVKHRHLANSYAIRYGQLHILIWLQEHQHTFNTNTYWPCNCAAEYGRLEILKYLRDLGCLWSDYTYNRALQNGNQELIKWMEDNGCPTN